MTEPGRCTFCEIVARREPAKIRYEDDDVLVFDNRLTWVPVMLLVIPKRHVTQTELWTDSLISKVTSVAVDMGASRCPGGFRILSNFGPDAMQSQDHGHVHVIGGAHLGTYS
ncbi:MAG: HIT domain-containing protein [Chloroflexi bacterium]|nr:HIT domain-containing protein [Chloroflexota bacterium]